MDTDSIRSALGSGLVIPALPLALDGERQWSERHQAALVRYYFEAGAGGLAVGVHSTQFAIRDPGINLLRPVLQLAGDVLTEFAEDSLESSFVKIAGICGGQSQAAREADHARELGYHAGLLSLGGLHQFDETQLLTHCQHISRQIPLVGFYLQPAVGGRILSYEFWRRFCEISNIVAIKIAPFNRYQTWDVVRAVIESGRNEIALYTGNDDNIIIDLLTPFSARVGQSTITRFIDGGLLGQWGVGTRAAVQLLRDIKLSRGSAGIRSSWLSQNVLLTDVNAALFDAANSFAGCLPGILEVLYRQGLVPSRKCLNENETLSPGQAEEISRVMEAYPHWFDGPYVTENLQRWLDG